MIRLLVIDDSALMRRLLTEIFGAAADFDVVVARGGAEALAMLDEVAPDVVTLDVNMPGMNGLDCLDRIMVQRPCPVVMVAASPSAGTAGTHQATAHDAMARQAKALGAVDVIQKPAGAVSLGIEALAPELVERVRAAARAHISPALRLRERIAARSAGPTVAGRTALGHARAPVSQLRVPSPGPGVVLVGCSTGGPSVLDEVLTELPADFPWPIVIAQHMPASFTGALARRLDKICALAVCEVDGTTPLRAGHAYIGRGGADLVLSRQGTVLVAMPAPSSVAHLWHPSVDRLVESAMRVIPAQFLTGVLMTGMGADGARAMTELHARGGYTLAESADTAAVWGMPGALVALGGAESVLPVCDIAAALLAHVG